VKVKCIADYPSDEDIQRLGKSFYRKQSFHVTIGREYIVFGMEFYEDSIVRGTGVWISFVSDYASLTSAPLCMFEIIDARASRFWECRQLAERIVVLWPDAFFTEYFHDDLGEGVDAAVEEFKRVRSLIEGEFAKNVAGDDLKRLPNRAVV
jgi:hypothetical protein